MKQKLTIITALLGAVLFSWGISVYAGPGHSTPPPTPTSTIIASPQTPTPTGVPPDAPPMTPTPDVWKTTSITETFAPERGEWVDIHSEALEGQPVRALAGAESGGGCIFTGGVQYLQGWYSFFESPLGWKTYFDCLGGPNIERVAEDEMHIRCQVPGGATPPILERGFGSAGGAVRFQVYCSKNTTLPLECSGPSIFATCGMAGGRDHFDGVNWPPVVTVNGREGPECQSPINFQEGYNTLTLAGVGTEWQWAECFVHGCPPEPVNCIDYMYENKWADFNIKLVNTDTITITVPTPTPSPTPVVTASADCWFPAGGIDYSIPLDYDTESTEGDVWGHAYPEDRYRKAYLRWDQDESCADLIPFSPNMKRLHVPLECEGEVISITFKQGEETDIPMRSAYCPEVHNGQDMHYQVGVDDTGDGESDWTHNLSPEDPNYQYQVWERNSEDDYPVWIGGDGNGLKDEHLFKWWVEIVEVNGQSVTTTSPVSDCVPVISVTIDGPTQTIPGIVNNYFATAYDEYGEYNPTDASYVIYSWDASSGDAIVVAENAHATVSWYYPGQRAVMVRAFNQCSSVMTSYPVSVTGGYDPDDPYDPWEPPMEPPIEPDPPGPGDSDAYNCGMCTEIADEYFLRWPQVNHVRWTEWWQLALKCYIGCWFQYTWDWMSYNTDMVGYYIATGFNTFAEWLDGRLGAMNTNWDCLFSWIGNSHQFFVSFFNEALPGYLYTMALQLEYVVNDMNQIIPAFFNGLVDSWYQFVEQSVLNINAWSAYEGDMLEDWSGGVTGQGTGFFEAILALIISLFKLGVLAAAWFLLFFFKFFAKLFGYVEFSVELLAELITGLRSGFGADTEAVLWSTDPLGGGGSGPLATEDVDPTFFWRGLEFFDDEAGETPLAILNGVTLGITALSLIVWTVRQVQAGLDDISKW